MGCAPPSDLSPALVLPFPAEQRGVIRHGLQVATTGSALSLHLQWEPARGPVLPPPLCTHPNSGSAEAAISGHLVHRRGQRGAMMSHHGHQQVRGERSASYGAEQPPKNLDKIH